MAGSMTIKLACVMLLCMAVSAPVAQAITCGDVSSKLAPCISYVTKRGVLTSACCTGIKGLNAAAKTPADRKAACVCIVSASKSISGVDYRLAAGLPGKCGVSFPFKISPSFNCNSIK